MSHSQFHGREWFKPHDYLAIPGAPVPRSPNGRELVTGAREAPRDKRICNDPSAGSPTETLLRLLLFGPFSATLGLQQADRYPSVQLRGQRGYFLFSCLFYANPSFSSFCLFRLVLNCVYMLCSHVLLFSFQSGSHCLL